MSIFSWYKYKSAKVDIVVLHIIHGLKFDYVIT
jgi:hypothetical protein